MLSEEQVIGYFQLAFVTLMLMLPVGAIASPADEANAAIDHWSAAYTSNDPEAVVKIIGRMQSCSEPLVP